MPKDEAGVGPLKTYQFFDGNFAIAEAQKCAHLLLEQTGSRPTWCIAMRKGFWPLTYHFAGDEDVVRRRLNQGHDVVLIVAVTRREALSRCSDYQVFDLSTSQGIIRRVLERAMRRAA